MATSSRPKRRLRLASPPVAIPAGLRLRVTPEQFVRFCTENRDLRLERTAEGRLIVMAPAGSESGGDNFTLAGQLYAWIRANRAGKGFDSSSGFTLPNGATVGPDVAWMPLDRWLAVPLAERKSFAPVCPDFVIELRSRSDRLPRLRTKMRQYIGQGVRLAWLIDPIRRKVEVYRPGREPEVLDNPSTLSGEDVLPGFVLDLGELDPG